MFDLSGAGPLKCDFCNEPISPLDAVAGNSSFICRNCASIIHKDSEKRDKLRNWGYDENGDKTEQQTKERKLKRPKEIRAELDEWVIGQEEAKRKLSVAVYHHYLRVEKG